MNNITERNPNGKEKRRGARTVVADSGGILYNPRHLEKESDKTGGKSPRSQSHAQFLRNGLARVLKGQFGAYRNEDSGIEANLNGRSLKKLGSDKAIEKSKANGFTISEHFEAAAKIRELYIKAKLVETSPDKKGSAQILSIKRFVAPFTLKSGRKATAYITVKESIDSGHKIYSVELMEQK